MAAGEVGAKRRLRGDVAARIAQQTAHGGQLVRGIGFVPGIEIEQLAPAAPEHAAAAQHLAAAEPADVYELVGNGDIEGFAVHLFAGDVDEFAQPAGYGVRHIHAPQPLELAVFTPF